MFDNCTDDHPIRPFKLQNTITCIMHWCVSGIYFTSCMIFLLDLELFLECGILFILIFFKNELQE